jgi:Glyoxalase-like domain
MGTANRIVPLGEAYLALVAVVDESDAADSVFGQWVAGAATEDGELLAGRCARTIWTPSPGGSGW